ncbi:MAG: hypothetical protein ACLPKI_18205 [Streptosporangiaceae bacterium]
MPPASARSPAAGSWQEVWPSRPVTVTAWSRLFSTASSVASVAAAK